MQQPGLGSPKISSPIKFGLNAVKDHVEARNRLNLSGDWTNLFKQWESHNDFLNQFEVDTLVDYTHTPRLLLGTNYV